jgi:hypothetical protein
VCVCEKSDLYDYEIKSETEDSARGDWVSNFHCDVAPGNGRLISPDRFIKAFTIADVYRLVEYQEGILDRRPVHRVLELLDEGWKEILTCSLVKSDSQRERELAVMREYGLL